MISSPHYYYDALDSESYHKEVKLVCIDNTNHESAGIKTHKIYDAVEFEKNWFYIIIAKRSYYIDNSNRSFVTLEEYRNLKIDKIIDEE